MGASPLGLASGSNFTATATPLGITPVPADLEAAVRADLKLVAGLLDAHVPAALHGTLGVSVGTAGVTALTIAFESGCAPPPLPAPATPRLLG